LAAVVVVLDNPAVAVVPVLISTQLRFICPVEAQL
jgi:hypothetical protein